MVVSSSGTMHYAVMLSHNIDKNDKHPAPRQSRSRQWAISCNAKVPSIRCVPNIARRGFVESANVEVGTPQVLNGPRRGKSRNTVFIAILQRRSFSANMVAHSSACVRISSSSLCQNNEKYPSALMNSTDLSKKQARARQDGRTR